VPYPLAHRDNLVAKDEAQWPDGRRVTQTPLIAGPLAFIEMMNSFQLELKQVLKYFIDFNMFKMMKIKYKSWDSLLIVIGIFCLIICSCESINEEKDPFKVISLEPLSDEIPFEELGSGKILFQRINSSDTSGFYIIDVDKRNSYGFTSNSDISWPYVSPDGSKIACKLRSSSDRNFIWSIYCMNIDGTNCIPVTNSGGGFCPTWSPDGLKILYYTNDIDGPLYMLSATENSSDSVEMIKFNYGDVNYSPFLDHRFPNISFSS